MKILNLTIKECSECPFCIFFKKINWYKCVYPNSALTPYSRITNMNDINDDCPLPDKLEDNDNN